MIQVRSKGEQLSYVDGYINCFRLFCEYLEKKSKDDAIASMTTVVNFITEFSGRGKETEDAEVH